MVFEEFDLIRIINLKERTDRRRRMMKELRRVGLSDDPRVGFFDAIKPADKGRFSSIGHNGVFHSHLAILEDAAVRGASVLILEDDCTFTSDAAALKLPAEWAIFYGGYYAADPQDLENSDIIGAHMMGFTADAAKQVANYFRTLDPEGEFPPIDGSYVWFRRANPDVKTIFARPPVGNQSASRSDIASLALHDRLPIVRSLVELARQVRNLFRSRDQSHSGKLEW